MNKSEILFIYDVKDANPNGDPLDENKPRIDEETGHNIVTDVRLKRTIRDYLFTYKEFNGSNDKDIFIREIADENGTIQDAKARARDYDGNRESILNNCIDIRLFGGTIPLEKDSITLTGPVQFKIGRSLHPVIMKHIKGTGAFASKEGSKQATFREEDILYYSLIGFHGIINPMAANYSTATEDDIKLLLEAMWEGTKNLISRSKFGHMPRLLLKINYKSQRFFIGDIDRLVKIKTDKTNETLRDISDLKIDTEELGASLQKYSKQIESVEYKVDDRLALFMNDSVINPANIAKDITFSEIKF